MYIRGLSDALTYITAENAIGAELTKCHYDGSRIDPTFLHVRTVIRIERQTEPKPIIATFLDLMREICADHLK